MAATIEFADAVHQLSITAPEVIEERSRLILSGAHFDDEIRDGLLRVFDLSDGLGLSRPTLRLDDDSAVYSDLVDYPSASYSNWRLIVPKREFAEKLRVRAEETPLVFFSIHGFHTWLSALDPFQPSSDSDLDLTSPITIRVHGLSSGFGGPSLWVLPVEAAGPHEAGVAYSLPSTEKVHQLIHVVSAIRVCPQAFALTWGDLGAAEAVPVVQLSAMVLAVCLVQELRTVGDGYEVVLRGSKRVRLHLRRNCIVIPPSDLAKLIEAVSWVYDEKQETRLKLVMDRLSMDVQAEECLVTELQRNLSEALQQARDSYEFVILERKDAYHKELRELLKDVRAQADLYAAKVRDLVSSLTRDTLGILVLFGFSFIGKFDNTKLHELLGSTELSLLVKFLAGYLLLSCTLQLVTHWRDAQLAFEETKGWRTALKNYTSRQENEQLLLAPIRTRRETLTFAMWVAGALYGLLAFATWNLPFIVTLLMAQ